MLRLGITPLLAKVLSHMVQFFLSDPVGAHTALMAPFGEPTAPLPSIKEMRGDTNVPGRNGSHAPFRSSAR